MATQWVYAFTDERAGGRDLLGGKGANLAEMTRIGLPVPPGFTITTEACNVYLQSENRVPDGLWEQVDEHLAGVTRCTTRPGSFPGCRCRR